MKQNLQFTSGVMTRLLSLIVLLMLAPAAMAQEAPPLEEPDAVTGIVEMPAPVVPASQKTASGSASSSVSPATSWNLCPEPQEALNNVPASAEKLQADIDRYALCVNRAELLMKLEEIKNKDMGMSMSGMSLPGGMAPTPLTPEQTALLMGEQPGAPMNMDASSAAPAREEEEEEKEPVDVITVNDIRGVNGELMARVKDQDGNIATVGVGDKLTDGSEITAISATQVTVRRNGETTRLEWGK